MAETTQTSPSHANPASVSSKRFRLLVIDDEAGPRESLKMIFNRSFEVHLADSGEAGVALARDTKFALAIVDIRMQGMSGIEVLRHLKEIYEYTEVIILTAYESLQTAREAVRHGASDYLSKPFDVTHIQAVVERCLKRYHYREEQLAQAEVDLNRAKNEFLSILSHELNTPMNGIMGLQEILGQTPLSDEQRELLRDIEECSLNLFEKINDLLNYARLTTEAYSRSSEWFNPASLILKMHEIADSRGRGNRFKTMLGSKLPSLVKGPEYEIHLILLKLLDNALKFSGEGDAIEIGLEAVPLGPSRMRLTFTVYNEGEGMPDPVLNKGSTVEPFTVGDASSKRRHGGLGMGLALCHRLCDQIGTEMSIQSTPRQGCRISFPVEVRIP